MWPPLAPLRARTCLGMLETRVVRVCTGISHQQLITAWVSSATLVEGSYKLLWAWETSLQRFSIGFISGDIAGHSMCSMASSSKKLRISCVLWGVALSSWKKKIGSEVLSGKWNHLFSQNPQTLVLVEFSLQDVQVTFTSTVESTPNCHATTSSLYSIHFSFRFSWVWRRTLMRPS